MPIMPLSCVCNVKNVEALREWLKYWLFVWDKFGFEKSYGNRNFGFDLLASVQFGFLKPKPNRNSVSAHPKSWDFEFRDPLFSRCRQGCEIREIKGHVKNKGFTIADNPHRSQMYHCTNIHTVHQAESPFPQPACHSSVTFKFNDFSRTFHDHRLD